MPSNLTAELRYLLLKLVPFVLETDQSGFEQFCVLHR